MGEPIDLGRRRLLTGGAAAVAALLVGCGDDADDGAAPATIGGAPPTRTPVTFDADPFGLGVASGDPLPDRVVLWTRLAVDPLAADGLGAMPDEAVDVEWEVATDGDFASVVRSGTTVAEPGHAHAVHVDVDGLDPATEYHYRFHAGGFTSPTGRTRTLPEGSPERFAVAVANCQWLETGAYGAYRHLVDEDVDLVLHLGDYIVDLVLHLGDYIYEYAGIPGPRMAQPDHELETLADYRLRYASYRLDPELAAAHARFPFCLTWDDHEVANNHNGEPPDDRRAAAYQAWWEHLPVRVGPPDGPALDVRQAFDVGDLARVVLLDERQHSDVPPCRAEVADDFGDCDARTGSDRSLLGDEQEAWLADQVAGGATTWTLVGNPVVLAGVDAGDAGGAAAYYLDSWDGFPAAQQRLIGALASASYPVVLTGDYHAGMVLEVHERPFEASPVVATEFMAPPISSPLFAADVTARTPHLRQQLNGHGYLTVVVEPGQLTASFRVLDDVQAVDSPIRTAATWRVAAGSPTAEQLS